MAHAESPNHDVGYSALEKYLLLLSRIVVTGAFFIFIRCFKLLNSFPISFNGEYHKDIPRIIDIPFTMRV